MATIDFGVDDDVRQFYIRMVADIRAVAMYADRPADHADAAGNLWAALAVPRGAEASWRRFYLQIRRLVNACAEGPAANRHGGFVAARVRLEQFLEENDDLVAFDLGTLTAHTVGASEHAWL
jgi:hypothetical protein